MKKYNRKKAIKDMQRLREELSSPFREIQLNGKWYKMKDVELVEICGGENFNWYEFKPKKEKQGEGRF